MGGHSKTFRKLTRGFWFKLLVLAIILLLVWVLGPMGAGHSRLAAAVWLAPPTALPAAPALPWYLCIFQRAHAFFIEWVRLSRCDPISSELQKELRRRELEQLPKPREPEARIWLPIQEESYARDAGAPLRAVLGKRKLSLQSPVRFDPALLPPPFGESR